MLVLPAQVCPSTRYSGPLRTPAVPVGHLTDEPSPAAEAGGGAGARQVDTPEGDPGMARREIVASGSFSRRLITSRPFR
jgi:hypothetical protein